MEQTAIEIFKTFGIFGGIIIALIIAIIKGYPELLKIIQKKQEIKEKEVCKNNKILAELTLLITNEQSHLENKITVELKKINEKLDDNRIESIRRSVLDFGNDIRNNEKKSLNQWEHILKDCDKYMNMGLNSFYRSEIEFIKKEFDKIDKL